MIRKIVIIIFLFSLLSWILAIASGCKTTKHISKSESKTDSIAARVIESSVTSELEHTAKDLLDHSEIKKDESEKIIVTTTEEFKPDPKTGAPQLTKKTTHITRKKNNIQTTSSKKTDKSIVDIRRDSAGKKDSSRAIVHRSAEIKIRDVKRKTPFGLYAAGIAALLAAGYFIYKKSRA